MMSFKKIFALLAVLVLSACGGGGGSSGAQPFGGTGTGGSGGTGGTGGTGGSTGSATVSVSLSNSTVSSAAPVTVTATVLTAAAKPAASVVVSFTTSGGLGSFSSTTALTNNNGVATVTLSPSQASASGADTVVASATVGGAAVSGSTGFSLVATTASITSFTSATGNSASAPLSAYGQTVLTVGLSGVSSAAPVTLSMTSACVAAGKATISPSSPQVTSSPVTFTYKDTGGCGATLATDTLTVSISGAAAQQSLQLFLSSPVANNIVFVSATPPTIYLQGTGLTTSSQVVFQVNDAANNPLPGQIVTLNLNTFAGGLTLDGGSAAVPQTTDSNGQVTALVNSGTVPTPVRVTATLGNTGISTVSSNLSVAVGLPSELHFSLSQGTINIEGYDHDGVANTYEVIASDRLGNPVPNGTAINFIAEGGQVQAAAFTATIPTASTPCPVATAASSATGNGLSCAVAQFQTSSPRPADGRITLMAYALGEKSFVDTNGNNLYDATEPFQDLGNPYLDTLYNGQFNTGWDQYIVQSPAGGSACNSTPPSTLQPLLQLDVSIPSAPSTCTGTWGKAYVRRAVETILSTSAANPMWTGGSETYSAASSAALCGATTLIVPNVGSTFPAYNADGTSNTGVFYAFGNPFTTYYTGASSQGVISFFASDANPVAFNPMAAGTTVSVSATTGLTVAVVGGSPVPNTAAPNAIGVSYSFTAPTTSGTINVTFKSPLGLATTVSQAISTGSAPSGSVACP